MLEHGGDIKGFQDEFGTRPLDYSANIAPLGVPDSVRQAVFAALDDAANYPDPLCRDLTRALSMHEGVKENCILCGNGSSDLLFRLVATQKPKRALLCAPTFGEYEQALGTRDAAIDYYPLAPEHDFTIGSDIINFIAPETDLVILCQPNNPTGQTVARELLRLVLEKLQQNNGILLVDECFVGFLDDPQAVSVVPWIEDNPQLVVLKAFTKLYGIPGIRLGYALTSNVPLLQAMRAAGQPWSVSNLAQAAGITALQCTEYVSQVRAITHDERLFLMDELGKRGIKAWGTANYLLFYVPETACMPTFVYQMRQKGVLVRDCSNYRNLEQGWYRIAVRTHAENVQLLCAIDAVLRKRSTQGSPKSQRSQETPTAQSTRETTQSERKDS